MKILGVKLTHDGAVAGIEDGKLMFCVEREKIANGPRYGKIEDLALVAAVCRKFNFTPDNVVVDGWKGSKVPDHDLTVSSYHEHDSREVRSLLTCTYTQDFRHQGTLLEFYGSYPHMTGHIIGSYATSPWAKDKADCYVITMDGGQNPRVHYLNPATRSIKSRGTILELYGIIYGIMGRYFGPYTFPEIRTTAVDELPFDIRYGGYEVPGKIMSWIATGDWNVQLMETIDKCYEASVLTLRDKITDGYNQNGYLEHLFMRMVCDMVDSLRDGGADLSDADVLHSIHKWLEQALVFGASVLIPPGSRVIFTGGSALNIKWNSALRRKGFDVWVPPFPNDSGSAIGAACAEMAIGFDKWHLDWSVYAGPELVESSCEMDGWESRKCNLRELAQLIVDDPLEPIVFLNGRAEVGPRALGNRSMIASTEFIANRDKLNIIKKRELFRPVAPICLEHHASRYFTPGTSDPYMLFDHRVREEVQCVIPAVVHLDGTARLQTITHEDNPVVAELLEHYYSMTGIPMLCNTSANLNGSGFFPDVRSAMEWGLTKYVWSGGNLYINRGEGK